MRIARLSTGWPGQFLPTCDQEISVISARDVIRPEGKPIVHFYEGSLSITQHTEIDTKTCIRLASGMKRGDRLFGDRLVEFETGIAVVVVNGSNLALNDVHSVLALPRDQFRAIDRLVTRHTARP